AFSLHAHYCAEHVAAIRQRVGEMREPPLGLEVVPDAALQMFFDEIQNAPSTELLILGIYEKALPAFNYALERHRKDSNPLIDSPTHRICRFAAMEAQEMIDFGNQAAACLIDEATRNQAREWLDLLDLLLRDAGELEGGGPRANPPRARIFTKTAFRYERTPKRDERFSDPYNMGVHAETFLYDQQFSARDKTLMIFFKRLREIDVPEMMASIIQETEDKPWEYYREMTRQLWDEARHAIMGELGFVRLGIDWTKYVRPPFTWSLALNTQLEPKERHAVLYFIEQGLMPKTGKRYEWEVATESGDPFAALCQDYDWADEVLHARIGRDWYAKEFGTNSEAIAYGDLAWSRVLIDWSRYREEGLTGHENWWPELYRKACQLWEVEPNPETLSYQHTYESTRADLKTLAE
ncbi:MAG TPA: hypothetical protein VE641_18925, partial [Chthoniobacterales bacterium]|nr:hypothetical protein [Chthoniobacterales bacterium]